MPDPSETTHKFRYATIGLLIVVNFVLLAFLGSALQRHHSSQPSNVGDSNSMAMFMGDVDSANVVTNSFVATGHTLNSATIKINNSIVASTSAIGNTITATGQAIGSAAHGTTTAVGSGFGGVGHLAVTGVQGVTGWWFSCLKAELQFFGDSWSYTFRLPATTVGLLTEAPSVSALITPASASSAPVIDAPSLPASLASAQLIAHKSKPKPVKPQWPIHGVITTLFGVPEPPYQPIHTGIDISDGKPAGVTPVYPVMPGRVIQVIHERIKLGNEVVIDHGHGLTSVYGHMHDTAVKVGQEVTQKTVLGHEGSTGVSTGPHVHLEMRQDGVAKNPMNYIPGRP